MAYATGTGTTHDTILTALSTFLQANGWTEDEHAADGDGYRLIIHKGAQYIVLRSTATNPSGTENSGAHIWLCGAGGYSSGSAWNAQPGTSAACLLRDCGDVGGAGHVNYYFFLNGDTCYIVIEKSLGVYCIMAFGWITKNGYTGESDEGRFVQCCYFYPSTLYTADSSQHFVLFDSYSMHAYQGQIYLTIDGTENWHYIGEKTVTGTKKLQGTARSYGISGSLRCSLPCTANAAPIIIPLFMFAERTGSNWSPVGQAPDIGILDITNYPDAEEVEIGAETWVLFPQRQRASVVSSYRGYAFKKVTS